jgi:hypothetical protein
VASDQLERNLREGIEAARRGDKLTARRLLQSVLQQDRTNETALMWMASVVDTAPEKRAYLEQVLRINPNNDRARQALEKMGGAPPPAPRPASGSSTPPPARPMPPPKPAPRRGMNPYFLAAIGVAAVMAIVLLFFLGTQPGGFLSQAPTPTDIVIAAFQSTPEGETTPDADQPLLPTDTPRPTATTPGILVTIDPNQVVLPPTFTPTPSPEPSATVTPSATPVPLSGYPILFASVPPGESIPSLFAGLADGIEIREIGDANGYYDIALSPDGTQIAFVRNIAPDSSSEANFQLFVAPVTDPADARQLTGVLNAGMEHPAWSGDGRSIVFAANIDGDLDLFRVPSNPDGQAEPEALTTNDSVDNYPAFAPGGDTLLFVSDMLTPGFTRLFTMSPGGVVQPFSNVTGTITDPVYAPDGSRVAYINQQTGDPDIWVINAEGQRPSQLTVNDSAEDRAIAWSPDGQWIGFASDRINGQFMWFFQNVANGEVVRLDDLAAAQSLVFLPR